MGIRDRPTSYRSPWQNGYVERLIGSIRRECTDHLLVFNVEHLRRILSKYASNSETLSRIQSLADYTIDTLESSFQKRQVLMGGSAETASSRVLLGNRFAARMCADHAATKVRGMV